MKVAILTMFNGLTRTYSLVNVVSDHLEMMLNNNVDVTLFVCEHFNESEKFGIYLDERLKYEKICNTLKGKQINWYDYSTPDGKVHDTFEDEKDIIATDMALKLKDFDICFMHDILYQGWHLIHNVAIRKAQESLPNLKFIAMNHSMPVNRPTKLVYPFSCRYTEMKNTKYIYPTYSGLKAVSMQYGVPLGKCHAVYNTIPLITDLDENVLEVSKHIDIINADYMLVYPARLTTGKKFEKVAAFAGSLKTATEKSVKVVFCDFASSDISPDTYKRIIIKEGIRFGLEEEDILFTSNIGFPNGFPRTSVLNLFTLSNIYVCPSLSESFGLTILEAGSRGNFIVLNEAVPALEELGKNLGSYFMRWDARNFGFDTSENYLPSECAYYEEHAGIIANLMNKDTVLSTKSIIKQTYSPNWVWKNQLEPLLEN